MVEGLMKTTQIIYLLLLVGIVVLVLNSNHIFHFKDEGFENLLSSSISEPKIPKGLVPAKGDTEAMPNPLIPGGLPFGPYAQMASVGSFQYQDPSSMPASLVQMKKLNEDLRSFLVFEGIHLSNSSDPTVSLPLTQLRADARKLQDEVAVLDKNPGVQSQLTQQVLADIEGSLTFLQKKVRLFETSGVISEGFRGSRTKGKDSKGKDKDTYKGKGKDRKGKDKDKDSKGKDNKSKEKKRATKSDIVLLQTKTYAAILALSASGTVDPVVQARIKRLQEMYTALTDMVTKLNKGQWKESDIPVYKEDIQEILPNLAKPQKPVKDVFSQGNGKKLNLIEEQLSNLVGAENAQDVFKNLKERGMFKISMDLGYNVNAPTFKKEINLQKDGTMKPSDKINSNVVTKETSNKPSGKGMEMDSAYDTNMKGSNDNVGKFDWKKRADTICEQVKLRGLDPLDFGCIPKDSLMTPAYSWRGYTKMVCGRLGTTMDPGLPVSCGCPPQTWKGWTSFQ